MSNVSPIADALALIALRFEQMEQQLEDARNEIIQLRTELHDSETARIDNITDWRCVGDRGI